MIPRQLAIKLSIEPNLYLASFDTNFGIYLFHGQDAMTVASFVERYTNTDLNLELNNPMDAANKRNRLVADLIDDAKALLKDNFSETKLKRFFVIIKTAKSRGLLGTDKPRDCCLADAINTANDLLRVCKFDRELSEALKNIDTLYVYICLVSLNCISVTA